jgi:hypothetical protein
MLVDRLPEWLKDDPHFRIYHDEIDASELGLYYNVMCVFVPQPIQLWTKVWTQIEDIGEGPFTAVYYDYNVILRGDRSRPLKEVQIYDKDDNLLSSKEYSKYNPTFFDHLELVGYSDDQFYVKVAYHGFTSYKEVGFPQDPESLDEKYLPNENLDLIAKSFGMFRRTYKDDITSEELPNTYPPYYPYSTEQDFYLEKRLLSEYVVVDEPVYDVDLLSVTDVSLINLESKGVYPRRVTVTALADIPDEVEMLTTNQQGFETDLAGWGAVGDSITLTRDTSTYHSGSASMRISFIADNIEESVETDYISCRGGEYYKASLWIKGDANTTKLILRFVGADFSYEYPGETISLVDQWGSEGEWTYVEIEGRAPQQADGVVLKLQVLPILGQEFWIDDASIIRLPVQEVGVTAYEVNGEVITEDYSHQSLEEICNQINEDSEVLTAEYLEYGVLDDAGYQLKVDGILKRFGILSAEIFGHFETIPDIVDVWEYILKWNIDEWNGKYWGGGEEYVPGSFYLNIPLEDIPSNIILLSQNEIQAIADKCKMFGTRAFPRYTVTSAVDFTTELLMSPINIGIFDELELESFVNATSDVLDMVIYSSIYCSILEEWTDELNLASSVSAVVASIVVAEELDTNSEFDTASQYNTLVDNNRVEIDQTEKTQSANCKSSENSNTPSRPGYTLFSWTQLLGNENSGEAYAKNTTSNWALPKFLRVDFTISDAIRAIPDDAIITDIEFSAYVGLNSSGSSFDASFAVSIDNTLAGFFTDSLVNGGWTTINYDGSIAQWYYPDDPTISGEDIKNEFSAYISTANGIAPNGYIKVDAVVVNVSYKYKSGYFMTKIIDAPTIGSGYGEWDSLTHTLTEALPSGCNVKYNIIKDTYFEGMTTTNNNWQTTSQTTPMVAQAIWPDGNEISGLSFYLHSIVGSPTDELIVSIYNDYASRPGEELISYQIPAADMSVGVMTVPIAIVGLEATKYWIVFTRSGSNSNTNYWKVGVNTNGDGTARYWNGSIWTQNTSGDELYHKLYKPTVLAADVSSGYDMEDLEYTDIRVQGVLSRTNTTNTPKLDKLTVKRREVIE